MLDVVADGVVADAVVAVVTDAVVAAADVAVAVVAAAAIVVKSFCLFSLKASKKFLKRFCKKSYSRVFLPLHSIFAKKTAFVHIETFLTTWLLKF